MLDAALTLASKGLFIFPIKPLEKTPMIYDWQIHSTINAQTIHAWWQFSPDTNIGIDCGKSNIVVIDIDAQHNGIASWTALTAKYTALPETYSVKTPQGGFHLYFKVPEAIKVINSVSKLCKGVDTRAIGGYVVAQGSKSSKGSYSLINDSPISMLSKWLSDILIKKPNIKTKPLMISAPPDKKSDTYSAIQYLHSIAPAIQGDGGDLHTYKVACVLRDKGISENSAVKLMQNNWNERCIPNWSPFELRYKVNNAYSFATGEIGTESIDNIFNNLPIKETKQMKPKITKNLEVTVTLKGDEAIDYIIERNKDKPQKFKSQLQTPPTPDTIHPHRTTKTLKKKETKPKKENDKKTEEKKETIKPDPLNWHDDVAPKLRELQQKLGMKLDTTPKDCQKIIEDMFKNEMKIYKIQDAPSARYPEIMAKIEEKLNG